MFRVVDGELIEVQGNSAVCRCRYRDPAARESMMRDPSLFARVIPIAIRSAVLQFEAFVTTGR